MALKKWYKKSESVVETNPYWTYKLDTFETEDGKHGNYHYVYTLGSTLTIPVSSTGKIIMVNQFRYLNQRESLEFACGGVEKGLSHYENAIKELREETGFTSDSLTKIGEFNPYNGVTNEMCSVYLATNLLHAPLPADKNEELEIFEYAPDEIDSMISDGKIYDGMTIAAWHLAKQKVIKVL